MGTGQAYSHQESLIQMKWTQEEIEPSVARAPTSFVLKGISLAPGLGSLPSLRKSVPRTERLLKREGGRERQKKEHKVRCPCRCQSAPGRGPRQSGQVAECPYCSRSLPFLKLPSTEPLETMESLL